MVACFSYASMLMESRSLFAGCTRIALLAGRAAMLISFPKQFRVHSMRAALRFVVKIAMFGIFMYSVSFNCCCSNFSTAFTHLLQLAARFLCDCSVEIQWHGTRSYLLGA